ncbi:MAG: hypothetical protein HC902_00575 [Calothrix sp. SM1_5_4]|nr:hypothetical protein [Calothrix sp. SM1_5_4]
MPTKSVSGSLFVLTLKPERSADSLHKAGNYFKRPLVLVGSGEVLLGERDEAYVYFPSALEVGAGLLVQDGSRLLRIINRTFEPQYGSQCRRFAYEYVIQSEGGIMQQTVTINGNDNTVGDITQQKSEWNYTPERMEQVAALLGTMKTVAGANNADQRLIDLLDKAIAQKQDRKTILSTLNQLVGWAADYGAVIGPFVPAINGLLHG